MSLENETRVTSFDVEVLSGKGLVEIHGGGHSLHALTTIHAIREGTYEIPGHKLGEKLYATRDQKAKKETTDWWLAWWIPTSGALFLFPAITNSGVSLFLAIPGMTAYLALLGLGARKCISLTRIKRKAFLDSHPQEWVLPLTFGEEQRDLRSKDLTFLTQLREDIREEMGAVKSKMYINTTKTGDIYNDTRGPIIKGDRGRIAQNTSGYHDSAIRELQDFVAHLQGVGLINAEGKAGDEELVEATIKAGASEKLSAVMRTLATDGRDALANAVGGVAAGLVLDILLR